MIEEKDLIKKAKKGEQGSFGVLYDKYMEQIYRFTLLKVSSREEAEDITHDVFLSAWQNIGGYEFRGYPLSSWLYQIARNKIIDYYRSKNIGFSDIDEVDESEIAINDLPDKLDINLGFENVKRAINLLGQEQQDVVIMRYVEDMPYEEIAKILNKSEGAVRLIQHRAINNLKKVILRQNNVQVQDNTKNFNEA